MNKVTDPQASAFINNYAAPASNILFASDLLKDPFVDLDNLGMAMCSPSLVESLCSFCSSSFTAHCTGSSHCSLAPIIAEGCCH